MPDDLSVAVEKLRTSTQRLNQLTDAAARLVREVESFLERCQVGVYARILLSEGREEDGSYEYKEYLEYRRVEGGKFRLAVVAIPAHAQGPEDEIVRPWSECNRDEKLESIERLPELLVELAKQVDDRTAKAERTMASVGGLLQSATKRKGDQP